MTGLHNVQVANIVASGKFNVELELAPVAEDLRKLDKWISEVEHSRRSGNRLLIYFVENDALGILSPKGTYVFNGVNTFEEVEDAREKLLKALGTLGIISSSEPSSEEVIDEFAIQNLVCTADLEQELNLNAIAIGLGLERTEYEPEQFPGLIYKLDKTNCTVLIFATGKVVITGVRDTKVAQDTFENLLKELDNLGSV